jgi:hypothetical protein
MRLMREVLIAVAVLTGTVNVVAAPVHATDADVVAEARTCAAIMEPAGRLQCFDLLVGENNLNTPRSGASTLSGAWSVSDDKSPLDDSKKIVAILAASSVTGGQGIGNPVAALVVRCSEGELNLYLATSEFVGMREGRTVLIRLGAQTAKQDKWTPSSDGKAVGLWGGDRNRAASLANDLIRSDQPSLVIRSDIYNAPPLTAQFDVTGARQALEPIVALCSAKPTPKTH